MANNEREQLWQGRVAQLQASGLTQHLCQETRFL